MKHKLKLDRVAKAITKGYKVYICQRCPSGFEATSLKEAYKNYEQNCLNNMPKKHSLSK